MPSSTPRPITHADLAPKPRGIDLGSKAGALLTVLCILCGLLCFILALFAEATRSQVTWVHKSGGHKEEEYECEYSGNGKVPLICASVAFVGIAIVMLGQHSFMLIAISKTSPPTYVSWDPDSSRPIKSLTTQAAFFFVSTWLCFAVGEIMLLIGLSVESGHLRDWSTPRSSCLVVREGVFTAAGVFSLLTVFLAAGLYATALRVQWLGQEQETVRREVFESSTLYATPPQSPQHSRTNSQNNAINDIRQNQTVLTTTFPQFQSTLNNVGKVV